jgi:hypothetical protein
MTMKSIMGADNNTREQPLSNPRLGMEEPRKGDCLSLTVVLVLHHALVLGQRGWAGSDSVVCTVASCPSGLNGQFM